MDTPNSTSLQKYMPENHVAANKRLQREQFFGMGF